MGCFKDQQHVNKSAVPKALAIAYLHGGCNGTCWNLGPISRTDFWLCHSTTVSEPDSFLPYSRSAGSRAVDHRQHIGLHGKLVEAHRCGSGGGSKDNSCIVIHSYELLSVQNLRSATFCLQLISVEFQSVMGLEMCCICVCLQYWILSKDTASEWGCSFG